MKKLFMITATHALAIPGFAQTGSEALLGASDGIYSYVPFIQGLCYVIAALIAIVGAASLYMAMQTSPQQVSRRIVTSVGSCLCFVCMAISLPQFFGYESYSVGNGSDIAMNGAGGSSNGFLSTDRGGISQSGIITTIPPLSDRTGNWITFPPGSNMDIANSLMDIYNHMGSGVTGTYGRTLEYINIEFRRGNKDYLYYRSDYNKFIGQCPKQEVLRGKQGSIKNALRTISLRASGLLYQVL
jgi:hypothetical protein